MAESDVDRAAVHRRIVVGVDGSAESKQALRWGRRLADDLGCALEAVMVWQPPTAFEFNMTTVIRDWDPQRESEKALAALIDDVLGVERPPGSVTSTVVMGDPSRRLIDISDGAVLLVVGGKGHGPLAAAMGSVSRRCTEHARCPVLVARGSQSWLNEPAHPHDRAAQTLQTAG